MKIKRGEIYYANLCPVIGSEQGGVRPVLIIQNDIGNEKSPTTIIAPITSKPKKYMPTHVSIANSDLPLKSTVLLEHIRAIDKSRLSTHIGKIDRKTMEKVDRAIVASFGIEYLEDLKNG